MSTKTKPKEIVRLYELPQRAAKRPIINYVGVVMEFDHLDGMYSYCIIKEGKSKGQPFHLSASTPLTRIRPNEYEVEEY